MNVLTLFTWVQANWANIAGAICALIAACSVFIKALELVVAGLVGMFPGLKNADGTLKHIAWALDAASKWPILHTLSLAPKNAVKMILMVLALGVFFHPAPAYAQVPVIEQSSGGFDWALGPSLPAVVIDLKHGGQTNIFKGFGGQLSVTHDALKKEFLGKAWDLFDLDLVAFGTLVNNLAGGQFGQLALGGGFGTLSNLLMIVGGAELLGPGSPVPFIAFNLGFNFGFAPSSPPTGVAKGAAGLPRANTLYFGAP